MVSLLLSLLIAVLVVGIAFWIIAFLPLPAPFGMIARAICALILLFWVLHIVGVLAPTWRVTV